MSQPRVLAFACSILVSALGSTLHAQQTSPTGIVRGTVVTAHGDTLETVASAAVSATATGQTRNARTDRQGRFSFEELAAGTYTLRVIQVGYRPAEVDVVLSDGRVVDVEIVITVQPVELAGVDVNTDRETSPDGPGELRPGEGPSDAENGSLALRALEAGSGMATSGLARLFAGTPGSDPGDPSDVLFMRGSSIDQRLVLLDGAPVFTPFHVSGLLPAFDPGVLGSAHLYNGGTPAEYDGGLSHVLDLRTRPASGGRPAFDGSIDLLSGRLGARVPIGKSSGVAIAGRGLHAASERLLGSGFPYGYGDVIARADLGLGDGHTLEATGFLNQESVELDFGAPVNAEGQRPAVPTFPTRASWGNAATSVGYRARGERTTLTLRGALSAYDAELPIQATLPLFASGRTERARFVGTVHRSLSNGYVRVGASSDAIELEYRARRLASDSIPSLPEVASAARGTVVAAFVDGSSQVSPTVRIEGGVRLARYLGEGSRLAPHASVTWVFGEQAALTIRAGRSDQLTTTSDAGVAEALSVDALDDPDVDLGTAFVPSTTTLLSVASASHVVVSLDQFVSPTTRLGLEGWLRRYSGLGALQPQQLSGSGVDMRIARSGTRIEGWFGYSLSWYWSSEAQGDPFQGRQLLSAGLSGQLAGEGRASLQLSFGDGLPFTAISFGDEVSAPTGLDTPVEPPDRTFEAVTQRTQGNPPLAGGPSGDFLRLDGEVSWSLQRRWGSRSFELRPYVRVLNALNRRDAMFYYFEAWRDTEARPLAELSIMPIVGLSWHF